jgi:predicted Rossmann fold flavoprotein
VVAEQSLPVQMEVDLVPNSSFEELADRIQTWIEAGPRRPLDSLIEEFVPQRLVAPFLTDSGIQPGLSASQVPKKTRNRLVALLKGWSIGQVRAVPLEKGEVVAGGVSLEEVDPQTMRSKLIEGLCLCGEILDVAGPVGGYNLQAAFATGYVAGESAARASQE